MRIPEFVRIQLERGRYWFIGALALAVAGLATGPAGCGKPAGQSWAMVVMDPLAKDLACPCVGGYAQRDYRQLAAHLSRQLGQPVEAVFADELGKALRAAGKRRLALIIGKDSLVRSDAADRQLALQPLCRLTDRDGKTTLTGMFLVQTNDPARKLADFAGRRFFFGLADSDEKHSAALDALSAAGITPPAQPETRAGCSDAAALLAESAEQPLPVAVISSYAMPLLEGCGTVPRGVLRIVGETKPVPFVTVFAPANLPAGLADKFRAALLTVGRDATLLKALESKAGFVPCDATGSADWPDFHGPTRDGRVPWLPEKLPAEAKFAWHQPLCAPGLAGLAVADGLVFVADRDPRDERDVFLAFRAADGRQVWQLDYPAKGKLDYGNSPRATPVVRDGRVFLLGAFGQLHCLGARDGKVIWWKDLAREFGTPVPKWGYCSTPLLADGLLIVNPGASQAALAALDPASGRVVWRTPGGPAAYASLIAAELGGRRQIVGYDAKSLGGWDVRTGRCLWTLVPPQTGDFNVPSPVAVNGRLLVATENNGTRLYGFRDDGTILPEPLARADVLVPDTTTPVVAGGRLFGCDTVLRCLDFTNGLKLVWELQDAAVEGHVSFLATDERVLVAGQDGDLLLITATGMPAVISRLRVTPGAGGSYAHPALVGKDLFLRPGASVVCLRLAP